MLSSQSKKGSMLSSQSKKKKSKRMRRRQKGKVLVAPEMFLDLQIEILNRLPVKSLVRFKCVSKLWSSVIRSKGYLFASPPRLYISLIEKIPHNPVKSALLSLASISKSSNAFELDMTKQGIGGHNVVVLRGLILYTVCGQIYIYNPTTGQRVTLPAIKLNILADEDDMKQFDYFLGYDPVLDQYKVVCTVVVCSVNRPGIYTLYWVFLLEAGSSWKRIDFDQPHIPSRQGLCINGVIYYLAFSSVFGHNVISFDVRSEDFDMIKLPHAVTQYPMTDYNGLELIDYGGKPTLFDYRHVWHSSGLVNLWVLEDDRKWSRISLVLQPCQIHLVPDSISLKVIGTTRNGEVVLRPGMMSSPYYILYYDLHKNDLRRVDIKGISNNELDPRSTFYFNLALMDTGESIMQLKI